jgi:antitoxin CcdA
MRMIRAQATSRKAATNLSVRVDLVRKAKALKLNLSELFESSLEAAIRDAEQRAWLEANSEAIEAYNAAVAKRGVFSDGWRRF